MEVRKNPHEPAQVRGSRQKKTNRISGWSFLIGGGVAPPVKPSELGSFLLPMAASNKCGALQRDWQSIRGGWSTSSKTVDASSNP
jgi:hypothetical protein